MFVGIQIMGILFALVMIYITFLYYKKEHYEERGFLIWLVIWIGFMVLVVFPQSIYGIMDTLEIERTVDFFVIGGFLVFSVILFHSYTVTKMTQRKVEQLVRSVAIKNAIRPKKK